MPGSDYSLRSASTGLTDEARLAGFSVAMIAMEKKSKVTPRNVIGSDGLMLKSIVSSAFVANRAIPSPMTVPIPTSLMPSHLHSF